jgi:hypothetical protein
MMANTKSNLKAVDFFVLSSQFHPNAFGMRYGRPSEMEDDDTGRDILQIMDIYISDSDSCCGRTLDNVVPGFR